MRFFRAWCVGMGVLLGMLGPATAARAQHDGARDGRPALEAGLTEGIRALRAPAPERAVERLKAVFEADPAFVSAEHGAAAYWLGRAYEAADDPQRAYEVWKEGLDALDAAHLFDPRLADVFVRRTFAAPHGAEYPAATQAYLQLLQSVDWYPYAGETEPLVLKHLQVLTLLVPDALQRQTGLDRLAREGLPALVPGAAARLAAWWRSQDPAPASRNNERLEEHLRRVLYAEDHYRCKDDFDDDDFDDRGRVYIRLGAPSHSTSILFESMDFRDRVIDPNLTLNSSDFPANEFWYYEHVDDAAQFLFVEKEGRFTLGEVSDLLPSTLKNASGGSERGQRKARAAVRALEEIYRRLALYHPAFAARYQDVAAFSGLLDEADVAAQAARMLQTPGRNVEGGDGGVIQAMQDALARRMGTGSGAARLSGAAIPADRPDLFARSFLMRGHLEDERLRVQREAYVPRSYADAFEGVDPLPIPLRLARFLDDDGTTRTEIYWSVPVGALEPSRSMRRRPGKAGHEAEDYLLLTTVVQETGDYRPRVVNHRRHVLPGPAEAGGAAPAPQVYTARGDTGRYHLAVEWDQYTATLDEHGRPISLGMAVRANTFRSDTLLALRNDERILEMSDLKPMILLDPEQALRSENPADAATPYPFADIDAAAPLLLYFEVYHLAFDADDRTRYTIAYALTPSAGAAPLRPGGTESISAHTDYTGSSRTARESILLDLNAWKGGGRLDVVVRVTDRVTGRHVQRTLPFDRVRR